MLYRLKVKTDNLTAIHNNYNYYNIYNQFNPNRYLSPLINMKRKILVTAGIFGALAVITGAFGVHGLSSKLTPQDMQVWNTAVQYQFYHVFALIGLSTLSRYQTRLINDCYYLFSAGIIFFSGSLYLLAIRGFMEWSWVETIGPVTPLGGVLFIGGWITMAVAATKNK